MKDYNFKYFQPLNGQGANPHLFGAGKIDIHSIRKNIPHFEEVAVNAGLNAVKGAILKNTFRFFESAQSPKVENFNFPSDVSANSKDAPLVSLGNSMLGFPVYSNLIIRAGSYSDNYGNVVASWGDIFIDAVIFELNRSHNLITTDIQGRDNTIVQYISKKSWIINCKGQIFGENRGVYPRTDVVNLINALDANHSVQVDSWFLNMVGIYNMTISKKNIPQDYGGMEWQKFEFDAIADFPVVLRLT